MKAVVEANGARPVPEWMVINLPTREQIEAPVDEQLIVEFYSR